MVFLPRMYFATRPFLKMWKGKLSYLQLRNFIQALHKIESAHVVLTILMAKYLSEFRSSDNESMRVGFVKVRKGNKTNNSGKTEFRCDVTLPRGSLEKGALLRKSSTFSRTFSRDDVPTRKPFATF